MMSVHYFGEFDLRVVRVESNSLARATVNKEGQKLYRFVNIVSSDICMTLCFYCILDYEIT